MTLLNYTCYLFPRFHLPNDQGKSADLGWESRPSGRKDQLPEEDKWDPSEENCSNNISWWNSHQRKPFTCQRMAIGWRPCWAQYTHWQRKATGVAACDSGRRLCSKLHAALQGHINWWAGFSYWDERHSLRELGKDTTAAQCARRKLHSHGQCQLPF